MFHVKHKHKELTACIIQWFITNNTRSRWTGNALNGRLPIEGEWNLNNLAIEILRFQREDHHKQ